MKVDDLEHRGDGCLPAHLGIRIVEVGERSAQPFCSH
jgi:hypothetical protein